MPITLAKQVAAWKACVTSTLIELKRVLVPGGYIAFEVGEVRGGKLRLEDVVIPAGIAADLDPMLVLINAQQFTKTANCWGVAITTKGRTRTGSSCSGSGPGAVDRRLSRSTTFRKQGRSP